MNKYYYDENENQFGPFSIQELEEKKITRKTLVWTESMENWEEAQNVSELKKILKSTPPPLPKHNKKTVKVEAEISRKKEKIITPKTEVIIAKETKRIFKNSIFALIGGLILFAFLFTYNNGFSNYQIKEKLQNDLDRGTPYYSEVESRNAERQILKDESERLGYYYDKEAYGGFDTYKAIDFHERQINYAIEKSTKPSVIFTIILIIMFVLGKHIFNTAKWIEDKSKSEL